LTPEVQTDEFATYFAKDCAEGEQCALVQIDIGFEGVARGEVGMCMPEPVEE